MRRALQLRQAGIEAVDDLYPRVSVLLAPGGYPLDEELHQFAALEIGLRRVGLDLAHALPERQ